MTYRWILNLHGLGPVPAHVGSAEARYWLAEDVFDEFLGLLGSTEQVELTFDDGNQTDLGIAAPCLGRHGRRATFFACAGRIGEPGFLSPNDLRDLLSAGMGIGSHGWEHRSWRKLPAGLQAREWSDARKRLEDLIGNSVDAAACPFGEYDGQAIRGLRDAGFRRIYTSDGGPAWRNSGLLARQTITRDLCPAQFIAELKRPISDFARLWPAIRQVFKALR